MFWLDAHILRASSSTVWACTSKRPAIDRISCGSVIKRVGISLTPCLFEPAFVTDCAVVQRDSRLLTGGGRACHHDGAESVHRFLHLVVEHPGYPAQRHTGHAHRPTR